MLNWMREVGVMGGGGTGKQTCTLQQDQLMLNWMGGGWGTL